MHRETTHHPKMAPLGVALAPALLLLYVPADAAEQRMYRCEEGGEVTYSEEPCGPSARELDVQFDEPSAAETSDADAGLAAEEAETTQDAAALERRQRITAAERKIEHLRTERDRRLADLADKLNRGTESRADADYRTQVLGEMATVRDQYNTRIQAIEAELTQLRE
jgi:hypothetical protein